MEKTGALILQQVRNSSKKPFLIAIDGRCAAGKTTLAAWLQKETGCNVIHMDHFFLRREQRSSRRLQEPGGNVDYERFLTEVMTPLCRGQAFSYRPFDCKTMAFASPIAMEPVIFRLWRVLIAVILFCGTFMICGSFCMSNRRSSFGVSGAETEKTPSHYFGNIGFPWRKSIFRPVGYGSAVIWYLQREAWNESKGIRI